MSWVDRRGKDRRGGGNRGQGCGKIDRWAGVCYRFCCCASQGIVWTALQARRSARAQAAALHSLAGAHIHMVHQAHALRLADAWDWQQFSPPKVVMG